MDFAYFTSKARSFLQRNTKQLNAVRFEHEASKIESTAQNHRVNNLERRFLVWTGKYKKVGDVPSYVNQSTMERARNRMRIKIANYMMLATGISCIAMIYIGKQQAKRGETVTQANLKWHKEIKEQAAASKT